MSRAPVTAYLSSSGNRKAQQPPPQKSNGALAVCSQHCDVFHNAVPTLEPHAESIVVTSHRRGNALSPMFSGDFGYFRITPSKRTSTTNHSGADLTPSHFQYSVSIAGTCGIRASSRSAAACVPLALRVAAPRRTASCRKESSASIRRPAARISYWGDRAGNRRPRPWPRRAGNR